MSTYNVLPRIVSPTGYCTWFLVMLHATYWLSHWYTKMANTSQVETLFPSYRRSERDDPPRERISKSVLASCIHTSTTDELYGKIHPLKNIKEISILFLSRPPLDTASVIVPKQMDCNTMPDPPESHHNIKYEAHKLSCDGREKLNLDMDRFEAWAECSRLFNERCSLTQAKVVRPPISSSNSEDTRCAQDTTESTEDLAESDAESEDQGSHEREQDSCLVATLPSAITAVPVKRTQDSQARITATHSFMRSFFGQGLNDCNLIADNAKMAPDRAIDFDALVKRRFRSHRVQHRSRTTPKGSPRPHKANTKGLGMRTRAFPDQKKI
jgi:hypothetical protein